MTYPINTSFITCKANRSYRTRQATKHLVLHETVSKAEARRQLTYFNTHPEAQAGAHGFIDWNEVLLTLPLDEVAYHVGPRANGITEGYELCHASTKAQFDAQWNMAVQWFARRCAAYGRGADMIISHCEIGVIYGGTDHTDPDGYFAEFGKTVNDFRAAVAAILSPQEPTIVVYQYSTPLKKFTSQAEAVAYARQWDHASVVLLKDGTWLWDNWPKHELK